MTEETISTADASRLKSEIDRFVDHLEDQGFSKQMIGAGMSGVGLAMAYANGSDFDKMVEGTRAVIQNETAKKH